MGCLKNILLLTALFVFSPFLSIEARGGMDVSRESEYLSRWAKYNQTDQYAFPRGMRLLWKSSSESLGKCLVYRSFRKGYMLDLK